MSWNPTNLIRQMDGSEGVGESGDKQASFVWLGNYATAKAAMDDLTKGDVIESVWIAQNWTIERRPGNLGRVVINCSPQDTTEHEEELVQECLKEIWTLKAIRNDVSILAYCSPNTSHRYLIEMWQRETDRTLAEDFSFKDTDGTIVNLQNIDEGTPAMIARKIAGGIESVMRFYPLLTCRKTYSTPPHEVLQNLGYINTPGVGSGDNVRAPGNLSTIISLFEWVKCQDDCDEQANGDWLRTESWMGILKISHQAGTPWDRNLYGGDSVRWPMPLWGT